MDDRKFELILNRLLELSEDEKLNWKKTADPNTFLITLEGSSITIETEFAEDYGGSIFIFQFRNEKGEIVESQSILGDNSAYFKNSERLFELAKRKALNSDKTIDRILQQLSPDSITA